MPTKQQIVERERELTRQAVDEADRAPRSEWEQALERALRKQNADRAQLHADCGATGGHVFLFPGDDTCGLCGYDCTTPQRTLARNLTRA